MVKIRTIAGEAPIIGFEQFLLSMPVTNATHLITEYNRTIEYAAMSQPMGSAFFLDEKEPSSEDVVFRRESVVIQNKKNIVKALKKQMLDQIFKYKKQIDLTNLNPLEALETAAVEYVENFGDEYFCIIDLGRGNYLLTPYAADAITLRRISPYDMAIIVYKPHQFVPFKGSLKGLSKQLKKMMRFSNGSKCPRSSSKTKKSLR